MAMRVSRASGVSGRGWPRSASARAARLSSAASSRRRRVRTRARERSAALSSKEGFSVVAPTRTMVPSSMRGRKASCCALLKRWISSTKSRVPRPFWRRRRAASKIFFRSATPVKMALICTKARSVASARRRAMVVLPTPGGPQKTMEPRLPSASIRPSGASGPSRWSWPTTSSSRRGRRRSASGRGRLGGRGGGRPGAGVEEVGHEGDWPADWAAQAGSRGAGLSRDCRACRGGIRLESGWKLACHFFTKC